MIEDVEFVHGMIVTNFAFMKSIQNSVQYWSKRKMDLFAMIRPLGKPTAFITMSANERRWPHLLSILNKWSLEYASLGPLGEGDILGRLHMYQRAHLANENPVICCICFQKPVDTVMSLLQSKVATRNPFGHCRVVDYFLRTEFQHRGSPHPLLV
jgi:hypothetical protein